MSKRYKIEIIGFVLLGIVLLLGFSFKCYATEENVLEISDYVYDVDLLLEKASEKFPDEKDIILYDPSEDLGITTSSDKISLFGFGVGDNKDVAIEKFKKVNSFQMLFGDCPAENETIFFVEHKDSFFVLILELEDNIITSMSIINEEDIETYIEKYPGEEDTEDMRAPDKISDWLKAIRTTLDEQNTYGTVYDCEWKQVLLTYVFFVESEASSDGIATHYNLTDIDEDGVPELYCACFDQGVDWEDIVAGKLTDDECESISGDYNLSNYIESTGLVYTSEFYDGKNNDKIYKLENNEFTELFKGERAVDDEGHEIYFLDGQEVSVEEYNNKINKIYDKSKAQSFNTRQLSCDEVIKEIFEYEQNHPQENSGKDVLPEGNGKGSIVNLIMDTKAYIITILVLLILIGGAPFMIRMIKGVPYRVFLGSKAIGNLCAISSMLLCTAMFVVMKIMLSNSNVDVGESVQLFGFTINLSIVVWMFVIVNVLNVVSHLFRFNKVWNVLGNITALCMAMIVAVICNYILSDGAQTASSPFCIGMCVVCVVVVLASALEIYDSE
ncbi:MAG: hypothetical protein E7271_06825 [Lachnospiraceae bacterium]|nr:hypothetical protein [Lachnospiraceae bacterium]